MSKEKIKTRKCVECKEEFYSNYDKSEVCPTCHYKNKQKEKDKQISDLEAKLAESELEAIRWQEHFNNVKMGYQCLQEQLAEKNADLHQIYSHLGVEAFCEDIHEQALKEIGRLQQQLAEKEKEIENLNNRILISQLQAPEEQRLKIIGSSCCQYNPNQDKISFCIDKLEKTKKDIENGWKMVGYEGLDFNEVIGTVDNQIEQLKKEMK